MSEKRTYFWHNKGTTKYDDGSVYTDGTHRFCYNEKGQYEYYVEEVAIRYDNWSEERRKEVFGDTKFVWGCTGSWYNPLKADNIEDARKEFELLYARKLVRAIESTVQSYNEAVQQAAEFKEQFPECFLDVQEDILDPLKRLEAENENYSHNTKQLTEENLQLQAKIWKLEERIIEVQRCDQELIETLHKVHEEKVKIAKTEAIEEFLTKVKKHSEIIYGDRAVCVEVLDEVKEELLRRAPQGTA